MHNPTRAGGGSGYPYPNNRISSASSNSHGYSSGGSFAPLSVMINDEDSMRGGPSQRQQERQQQQQVQAQAQPPMQQQQQPPPSQQQQQQIVATATIVDLPPVNNNNPHPHLATALALPSEETHFETTYRGGFSTSLCDLFQDPRDRSSCCALTCCGTFLQDRNKFLLTGELPPPWWMRTLVYVGGFTACVLIGGLIDPITQLMLPTAFVVILMVRATTMRYILRQQLQIRMLEARPHHATRIETHGGRCEHWCCALVSNDKRQQLMPGPPPPQHERELRELQALQQADFCWRLWQLVACLCCDSCCFSWIHFNGMCATAQEDRELRRLLPPEVFFRDYITFEPYGDYYPQIEWLRQQNVTSFFKHLQAVSQLSAKLLFLLQCSILSMVIVAVLHIVRSFSLAKVFVVVATLAQAMLILYLVYWRNHRLDVSLDAIIKFFASGFVLAVTVAMVVELIVDTIGEIIFSIVMTNEYIDDHPEILTMDDDYAISQGGPFSNMDTFKALAQEHYITLVVYLFFKAVVVAALVEEMTKYYCFWMVEHPDYIWGERRHVNEEMGVEGAFCNDDGTNGAGSPSTASPTASPNASPVRPPTSPSESATTNMPPFRPRQAPRHTTAGAAITVGMIATAAGFSCSENLMYVFSQNSVAGEISVLLARSALPVHSICAAIQSVGVVRRDVEQDANYKIGWALFPAILLHGLFDFVLLALSFFEYIYSDTSTTDSTTYAPNPNQDDWFTAGDDDLHNQQPPSSNGGTGIQDFQETFAQEVLSFSIGAALTMIGVVYYINEAGKQRHRLQALEMTTAHAPSTATLVFT